ncbi:MAG: hypothetical protein IV097_04100 [Burkholderiaceae bacterium]|nr:hypothetical protein [Burkholderiaceae bacterium]
MYTLSPERILQLEQGFCAAQALVSAIDLGLFTELGKGPRTARQLRRALGLSERAMPDLPDTLVALGLLEREGDDGDAVYINTRESSHFLDRRSAAYIGQDLSLAHARALTLWGRLGDALRTGRAQGGPEVSAELALAPCWDDPAQLAQSLSELMDFSAPRRLAHLGGGKAGLCLQLAALHPQLHCCSLDLPGPCEAARAQIAAAGLGERVSVLPLQQPLQLASQGWPAADLLIVSLLHACSEKQALLAHLHELLPAGGGLLVLDQLIDDERRHNAAGLLASLNMLVEFGEAQAFSAADCKQWCLDAGFASAETLLPATPWGAGLGAVLARK